MTIDNPKLFHKLDCIIGEMLASGEPSFILHHRARLMIELRDEDLVRTQLVMALMAEIAENQTPEINEKRLEHFLKQLPVENTVDFAEHANPVRRPKGRS